MLAMSLGVSKASCLRPSSLVRSSRHVWSRGLQTTMRASSIIGGQQQQEYSKFYRASSLADLAALTAITATSAAGALTLCDQQQQPSSRPQQRRLTPHGLNDPRVSYLHHESDDNEDEEYMESTASKSSSSPRVQATSSIAKDPKTVYAIMAAKKEMEAEERAAKLQQEQSSSSSSQSQSLQATSSTTSSINLAARAAAISAIDPNDMTKEEARIEEATRKAKQHSGGLKLFSGNGNMALALEIARYLGINLGKATVGRFADGEVNVVIHENVRGKDCYVIQPTCPPVNDNIMELLLIVSTLNRASARRITVVIPYYGYARQDRKMQARVPISAADVARLMEAMGIDRVIAVDLHCGQIQGFFGPRVPVDNLDGGIVGLDYFGSKDLHNPVVVSPDAGGVYRAKKFKEGLSNKYDMNDIGLAMIIKQRARAGVVDQMDLVGDVKDCDCILVDDMIDTAGTICKASEVLVQKGARRVFAFASHGLLSGPGNERIANSPMEEVVILNTIPTSPQREANDKLTELSVAPLLAQAIFNIHAKKSISALFK